jgi:hypothetical protein
MAKTDSQMAKKERKKERKKKSATAAPMLLFPVETLEGVLFIFLEFIFAFGGSM